MIQIKYRFIFLFNKLYNINKINTNKIIFWSFLNKPIKLLQIYYIKIVVVKKIKENIY